jgi:uncharacterized OsmC-like protein
MDGIARALAAAGAYLTTHPDEARYTDSRASATVEGGLLVSVTGNSGEQITTDMPPSVGGTGSAPSPGWFLRAAEAACVATLLMMRAAQLGLDPGRFEVMVDSISDDRGILGLADDVPAGPLSARVAVRFVGSSVSQPELEELAKWAVDHCPVTDAVRRAVPLSIEISAEKSQE